MSSGDCDHRDADQPAHLCSLLSAIVIPLLESIISRVATSEMISFQLVSVARPSGLNLTLSETPKTGFLVARPK